MGMTLITGRKGSGKTLSAVGYAYDCYNQGRTVYSNIGLKFPHKRLTRKEVQNIMKQNQLQDCVFLIDEIHTITDARRSMTKRNVNWSYFFTQSRKRGVDIIATTQREEQVDLRYRLNCDYFMDCEKRQLTPHKFVIIEHWYCPDTNNKFKKINKHPENVFKIYSTDEIVFYDWEKT